MCSLYRLAVSLEVIAEVQDVLTRPKLREKFQSLTSNTIHDTLTALEDAEHFEPAQLLSVSRDPKDDKFLSLAVEAKAQFIVSEDNDLLVLHPYQGIQIINALDFLHFLQSLSNLPSDKGPENAK